MLKRTLIAGALLCVCSPAHAGNYWEDQFGISSPAVSVPMRHARPASGSHHARLSRGSRSDVAPDEWGPVDNPVLRVAGRFLGRGNFTGFPEAWCADAMNVWLRLSGHRPQASHRAIDFAHYGRPTSARVGAIAVLTHHVGVVSRVVPGGVILISGNHRARVGLGFYPLHRIIAFREAV